MSEGLGSITSPFASQKHLHHLKTTWSFRLTKVKSKSKHKQLCDLHIFHSAHGLSCSCGSKHSLSALNVYWWLEMRDGHLCQICCAQTEQEPRAVLMG